jgi:hypothetical protein
MLIPSTKALICSIYLTEVTTEHGLFLLELLLI